MPVVIAAARGVEAEDKGIEIGVEENLAVRGAGGIVELLHGEREVRAVAPGIGMTFIAADAQDGKGKLLICFSVCAAFLYLKARHIAREVDVAWVAVAAVGAVVARAGVVDENLNVLVAIVLLLGIQADR